MPKKMPFVRSASVYEFKEIILVVPNARTQKGMGIGMAKLVTTNCDNVSEVGQLTLSMLELCEDNFDHDDSRTFAPSVPLILKEVGLRSWTSFHQKSLEVTVLQRPKSRELEIIPMQRNGRYSVPLFEKQTTSGIHAEELGRGIVASFLNAG
jgi:hypothetical protein